MSKPRILIVDDEPRNQRIAVKTLADIAEYEICSCGEDAIKSVSSFKPDLILLNIKMSGMDGYETCKKIRANSDAKFAKIVLVSGKAMTKEKLRGYDAGADDYITKPFVQEELLAKARVFLRLSKFEQEMDDMNVVLARKVKENTEELKKAQIQLVDAAKMAALGEMTREVAHEINTPLTTISLLAEQIRGFVQVDPTKWQTKIVQQSEIILKSVHHIATIVQGLHTYSRDGHLDDFGIHPLKPIIENVHNLCYAKLRHHNVTFHLDEFDDKIHVYCRPIQIAQVMLNLISNAADAVELQAERWIKVHVTDKHKYIEICIMDSGRGIPQNIREKIFKPLFTTKESGKGTGLGLSISRGIMQTHSGDLTLNTDSPHTEFCLSLLTQAPKKTAK